MNALYAGIEVGGSKCVCAVGSSPADIRDEIRFPTTNPAQSISATLEYLKAQHERAPLAAVGIGSFGPLDLHRDSPTFGYITSTPKPHWKDTDFAGAIGRAMKIPIVLDTDTNAAALGEYHWGAAQGLDNFVYLTIGTGIGGGAMLNGSLLQGIIHPEMGHIFIPHDAERDPFPGSCPFHQSCLEGLASGTAMAERWKMPAEAIPWDHEAWQLEAHYIALALCNYSCILSPRRIIIGGGLMKQEHLFRSIRHNLLSLLNGYLRASEITERIDDYVVPPALGDRAGVLGAIALAQQRTSSP